MPAPNLRLGYLRLTLKTGELIYMRTETIVSATEVSQPNVGCVIHNGVKDYEVQESLFEITRGMRHDLRIALPASDPTP